MALDLLGADFIKESFPKWTEKSLFFMFFSLDILTLFTSIQTLKEAQIENSLSPLLF